jgi:hypothetical protein
MRSRKKMERLPTLMLPVSAIVLAAAIAGLGAEPVPFNGYAYPPAGWCPFSSTPELIGRVGEVLGAIDSPQRRSVLAEEWLRFSKQAIAKDLELQESWLQVQKQQTTYQQQVEQLRFELARLQMRIEELRAENLRLEQANLQMRRELAPKAGEQQPDEPAPTPAR